MALSWDLAICTYNRGDILVETLRLAIAQSRPPENVVIVDAGEDWRTNGERARAAVPETWRKRLRYVPSERRSLPYQRNQAVAMSTADILFMIDDDTFLYPECAAEIMQIYEADAASEIAAIGAWPVETPPPGARTGEAVKSTGRTRLGTVSDAALRSAAGRWFFRDVLMMSHERTFIPYDTDTFEPPEGPDWLDPAIARPAQVIPGFSLTVRRDVAARERFDPILMYYAALEDSDASHRFRRHGALVVAHRARAHHYQTAGGRLSRRSVIALQLMNLAVLLRRHARGIDVKRRRYRGNLARRLFAEMLKDLLAGRFALPQARGVLVALRWHHKAFDLPAKELEEWYPAFQRRVIGS